MKHTIRTTLSLLGVVLGAGPVSALDVPSCGNFLFFVQDSIAFENGPSTINGNVMVTSHSGTAKVGAHNVINGTLVAAKIFLGTDAVVDTCASNYIEGPGTCLNIDPGAFNPGAACLISFPPQPLSTPVVQSCVNTAAPVTVAANTTRSDLAPGCYGALRLNKGATLTLQAGEYQFRDVRMLTTATLNGPATLQVKGAFVTEPAVTITDLLINSAYDMGPVVQIFNDSVVTRVLINAPFGTVRQHATTAFRDCSQIVSRSLEVQPITTSCPTEPDEHLCPAGTHYVDDVSPMCVAD